MRETGEAIIGGAKLVGVFVLTIPGELLCIITMPPPVSWKRLSPLYLQNMKFFKYKLEKKKLCGLTSAVHAHVSIPSTCAVYLLVHLERKPNISFH